MKNTENERNSLANPIEKFFLDEISLLRRQKKDYFSAAFYSHLESLSLRIKAGLVNKYIGNESESQFQPKVFNAISVSTIDSTLECAEIYLRKISRQGSSSRPHTSFQVMQILTNISGDLYVLAAHIKYMLNVS